MTQAADSEPFDWHDYIHISSDFTPEQQRQLSDAFDAIVRAHDEEGIALIRAAGERNGGYLDLKPDPLLMGYSPENETIYLDFDAARRMSYSGIDRPYDEPSLVGILVHELYHAADRPGAFENLTTRLLDGLTATFDGLGVPWDSVRDEYTAFVSARGGNAFEGIHALVTSGPERVALIAEMRQGGQNKLADALERIPAERFLNAFVSRNLLDPNGVPRTENDATAFTNAFMLKNFGNSEVQRGEYALGGLMATPHDLPVPQFSPVPYNTPGFTAAPSPGIDTDPAAPPPSVRPTRAGRDVLMGCMLEDNQFICAPGIRPALEADAPDSGQLNSPPRPAPAPQVPLTR